MTEKISFILYSDYKKHFAKLSDEEAGRLIKAVFQYVEDRSVPELSPCADILFSFISEQLDRDLAKWEKIRKKRAEAGRKGGLRTQQLNKANASFALANQAENENENEYENENENENVNENVNEYENAYENVRANENVNVDAAHAGKEADASDARTPTSNFSDFSEKDSCKHKKRAENICPLKYHKNPNLISCGQNAPVSQEPLRESRSFWRSGA